MNANLPVDQWAVADAYEAYMGRWSRKLAQRFIHWFGLESNLTWLDVGCGTGALTSAICHLADPSAVVACDRSQPFVEHTRSRIADPRVSVVHADVDRLPRNPGGFDRVVSGLVLNFLPHPRQSVAEMRARTRPGGIVAGYVWDYTGRMEFLRFFWEEVVALDPPATALIEGVRFALCNPGALESLFADAGLGNVRSDGIEIRTQFDSFADYWQPFLGGTGPAPSYVASLHEEQRSELRSRLERRLTAGSPGSIDLVARAWAVRGTVR